MLLARRYPPRDHQKREAMIMASKEMMAELKAKREMQAVQDKAANLMAELADMMNVMSDTQRQTVINGMANGLAKQHRTLQSSSVSALVAALKQYGDDNAMRIDARNEYAVKYCCDLDPANFPFI